MLSDAIYMFTRASDLDRKILAVEGLLFRTKELKSRTKRFTKIAWTLDLILLFFAVLVFHSVLYIAFFYEVIESRLPPVIYQILDRLSLTGWLYCLLALVTLPVVSDIIFAIVCKHPAKAKVKIPKKAWTGTREKLRHIEDTLDNTLHELPWGFYRGSEGHVLCALATGLLLIGLLYLYLSDHSTAAKPFHRDEEAIFTALLISATFAGLFELLLLLKNTILNLAFSNRKNRKQIQRLRDQFFKYAKSICPEYKTRSEEYAEREKQRKQNEIRHYTGDSTGYLDNSSYTPLTDKDHDDLDAVAKAMADHYGPDWGSDL